MGKNTEVVCHSLLQWTTFCQTSPPCLVRLGWPHTAWLSFIESDKAVVHVIRLARCLCQSVCPLMRSLSTYCLTWVSLTLDVGYLFTATPAKCSHLPWPGMRGSSSQPLLRSTFRKLRSWHPPITSCQTDGETVAYLIFWGFQNHCRWWLQPWN